MKAAQGGEPFLLSYWYPIDVPSQKAAPIQIFNTCRALVEHGVQVTLYMGRMLAPSVEDCLAFYGIAPHASLRVVSSTSLWPSRRLLALKLKRALAATSARRHFLLSRGEPGIELFAPRGRRRSPGQRNVYEAHRLCYSHLPQGLGRRDRPVAHREPDDVAAAATTRQAVEARFGRHAGRTWALEKEAVENADGLLCLTKGVRRALEGAFHVRCPVLVLPSGTVMRGREGRRAGRVETDQSEPTPAKDIDVLYVGKFSTRKGLEDLVEAMRFLAGYRLWMVGGAKREVQELARVAAERGVADRIVFTGYVEPRRVPDFLRRARVGVCPLRTSESEVSRSFTSPLKILEMLAHEVPIVATDGPAVREILQPDRTALLVEPDNPQAMARALRALLEQPELARRLTRQASVEVEAYSWENRARRLVDFLRSIG